MNVFELFATLGIDTSAYDEGLDSAQAKGEAFGGSLGGVLATGGKIAVGAIAATTAATVAGTIAFVNGVSSVAEYGDRIDKMSQKMNMSAEAFQEWDFVMQHCGTSIETMKAGIRTLSSAVETDSEAFAQLGMSQEEIANMSGEELFAATITALQGVEDETERTYLAGKLLGKGATELGPLLNMTAEETEAMKQEVHDLGGVLSDEAVKASAGFEDSLQNMQYAFNGMKNSMLTEFLPSFSTVMDGLALIFSGDDGGLALIEEGVDDFIVNLNEVAPKFLEVGAKILNSLITSISSNLPKLISQGGTIINDLIQGIILALPSLLQSAIMIIGQIGSALLENAPLLVSTALDLIIMLADSFTQNAPVIIPAIVSVVKQIVSTLTAPDTLTTLISVALQLILALADGLVMAMPELISIIPMYYANFIQTVIAIFPDLLNAVLTLLGDLVVAVVGVVAGLMGQNYDTVLAGFNGISQLISSTFNNIVSWFTTLKTNISTTVSNMWNSVVNFFSTGLTNALNFVTNFGSDLIDNFNSTFDNAIQIVSDAINNILDFFNFEWKLPDLKLPHFTLEGEFSLEKMTVPTIGIDWYKKGYSDAYILNGATIFGAQGGSLLGGGEGSGGEVVVGTGKLIDMMSEAVRGAMGGGQTIVIPVYIGNEKIDELVVKSNQRNDYISGGR